MNTEELRNLSCEDLKLKLLDLRKEQFNLRLQKSNGEMNQTHRYSLARKQIARIKTIITQQSRCQDGIN